MAARIYRSRNYKYLSDQLVYILSHKIYRSRNYKYLSDDKTYTPGTLSTEVEIISIYQTGL